MTIPSSINTSATKCEICNEKVKNPCLCNGIGNHLGDSNDLADRILEEMKKKSQLLNQNGNQTTTHKQFANIHKQQNPQQYPDLQYHPLFSGQVETEGNPRASIEAHHIISSATMRDSKDWELYVKYCEYNINHHKNGIFLPYRYSVACHLRIALHRGGHTYAPTNMKNPKNLNKTLKYERAINERVKRIHAQVAKKIFCKNKDKYKDLRKKLDALSDEVLGYIDNFTWKVTKRGEHYSPNSSIGCLNATNRTEKKTRMTNTTLHNCGRNHPNYVDPNTGIIYTPSKVTNPLKVST